MGRMGTALPYAALVFLISQSCFANVGDAFGFGSRSSALGGAALGGGYDAFAAYSNPAGLADPGKRRLKFSYGLIYMNPVFTPITGVTIENTHVSDKIATGDVDTSYRSTFGQELGLSYVLSPDWYGLSIGIASFLPINQTAYIDTGENFEPEYILYRARTQRPQFEFGAALRTDSGLQFGVGAHIGFALTSNADVFLQTDANKPTSIRFSASLKPKASPFLGFLFRPTDDPDSYSIGAVVRFPLTYDNSVVLKSGIQALSNTAALDFDFNANSALFYDPLAVQLGGTIRTGDAKTYLQIDWERWSNYVPPILLVTSTSVTNCGGSLGCPVVISGGTLPGSKFRDIVIPRIGEELQFDGYTLRFGYAYRPGITTAPPGDIGNILDPSKHIVCAGVGFPFKEFLGYPAPWSLDLHLSYEKLVREHVVKSSGDEAGNTTDSNGNATSKIGAPGYDIGGHQLGGGVSLTLAF